MHADHGKSKSKRCLPIGVATYNVVKRLPKELKGQLPSPEEIEKLLAD